MKCELCGGDAAFTIDGYPLCEACVIDEHGACVICANRDSCPDRDSGLLITLCSDYERRSDD